MTAVFVNDVQYVTLLNGLGMQVGIQVGDSHILFVSQN